MPHVVEEDATQKETGDGKTVFARKESGINDHYSVLAQFLDDVLAQLRAGTVDPPNGRHEVIFDSGNHNVIGFVDTIG